MGPGLLPILLGIGAAIYKNANVILLLLPKLVREDRVQCVPQERRTRCCGVQVPTGRVVDHDQPGVLAIAFCVCARVQSRRLRESGGLHHSK